MITPRTSLVVYSTKNEAFHFAHPLLFSTPNLPHTYTHKLDCTTTTTDDHVHVDATESLAAQSVSWNEINKYPSLAHAKSLVTPLPIFHFSCGAWLL